MTGGEPAAEGAFPRAWYRLSGDEALARLGSSREGLAGEEAARRLATHGLNVLAETRGSGPVKVFLHQFASPLIYLLPAATPAGRSARGVLLVGCVKRQHKGSEISLTGTYVEV